MRNLWSHGNQVPQALHLAISRCQYASPRLPKIKRKREMPISAKESWREKMFLESPTKKNESSLGCKPTIIIGVITKL